MKRSAAAASPDAYVASVDGWRRALVEDLRRVVRARPELDEVIKWGHLVYLFHGPVCLIRAKRHHLIVQPIPQAVLLPLQVVPRLEVCPGCPPPRHDGSGTARSSLPRPRKTAGGDGAGGAHLGGAVPSLAGGRTHRTTEPAAEAEPARCE